MSERTVDDHDLSGKTRLPANRVVSRAGTWRHHAETEVGLGRLTSIFEPLQKWRSTAASTVAVATHATKKDRRIMNTGDYGDSSSWNNELPAEVPSTVPRGYGGPVTLCYEGRTGAHVAVLPDFATACLCAAAAMRPDIGGFCNVELSCAPPGMEITHATFEDWLAA